MPRMGERHIASLAAGSLVLEPVKKAHAAELLEPLSEPFLYEFVPDEPPADLSALQQRFSRLERGLSPDGDEDCLCWVIRKDGTAAGLIQATLNTMGQAFIGYDVFRPYRRQGVAKLAVMAVLRHLGRQTGAKEALAYVDTRNQASIAVLRSLGFRQRRMIPGADLIRGQPSDEYEFTTALPVIF